MQSTAETVSPVHLAVTVKTGVTAADGLPKPRVPTRMATQAPYAYAVDGWTYLGGVAILIYTGLRLLLLVAVIGLFHALGMRGILLLIAGFAVSAVLSYFLLSAPRDAMAQKMSGFFGRLNSRIDDATQSEDVEVDTSLPTDSESTTTPADVKLPQQAQESDRP